MELPTSTSEYGVPVALALDNAISVVLAVRCCGLSIACEFGTGRDQFYVLYL